MLQEGVVDVVGCVVVINVGSVSFRDRCDVDSDALNKRFVQGIPHKIRVSSGGTPKETLIVGHPVHKHEFESKIMFIFNTSPK